MFKGILTALPLAAILVPSQALAQPTETRDIVILGEVHDNADAHAGQAEALSALTPTAVVFEMLSPEDAERANADRAMLPGIWADSGWPDYAIYAPVFDALGAARIVGAASPRSTVSSVFKDGAAVHFGPDADRFGLTAPLPPKEQKAREAMQFDAHCEAMPREMMGAMVTVQRFRDAVFARAALDALETYGPPVAVITGNGHARTDWGIPAAITLAAPDVSVLSIAFAEGTSDATFDEVHIVPPAEREDPCARFRK